MGPRQCLARRSRQPSSVGHWSGYGRGAVTGRGPKPSNAAAALQGVPPPGEHGTTRSRGQTRNGLGPPAHKGVTSRH